jgi:serine/arginine repetitive matrix protein 1
VAMTAGAEAEVEAEILIAEYRDAVRVRRRTYTRHIKRNAILISAGEEGLHHLAASEISMSPVVIEVAAEEAVVTDLASVAALHRAVVPLLHHVAFDAHPLQVAHELRHGGEPEDHLPLIAPGRHCLVVPDVLLHSIQCRRSHDGEGTSPGLQATIAEGYLGICRALLPLKRRTNRAHHRPDRPDRVHVPHRVGVEDLLAAHAVQSESAGAGALNLQPTHTAREPT